MTNTIFLSEELLNEEQLDKVAGGNRDELALDTQLFNTMGGRFQAYTLEEITDSNVNGIAAKINSLWAKAGIQVTYNDFGANSYSVNGQQITRNEAIVKVLDNMGYHDIDPGLFMIKK